MLANGSFLHTAFAVVHAALLLILLIQTAFTQSNLASNVAFQIPHDAVATLWYITLAVLLGRLISSFGWIYLKMKKSNDKIPSLYTHGEKITMLVLSSLVVFPSAVLFGSVLGPSSVLYVERGVESNLRVIMWIVIIQGVWAFLELAYSHLSKTREVVTTPRKAINRFLLLVMIVMFLAYAATSTLLFLQTMKLKGATFFTGGNELQNALSLIYTFGVLQFVFMILTFFLYALKSMRWADGSVLFNVLAVTASALAFEFASVVYGMVLPYTSVVDVMRHQASAVSNIPSSGSFMSPNIITLQTMAIVNFFIEFALLVVIHLAAYSRV